MCYQVVSRGTGDVDVMFPPMPSPLRQAVATVGSRRRLESSWMNDGPAQFAAYGPHVAAVTLCHGAHLIVRAPRNEYLLGMKVQAARPEDIADTVWLMADTGLRTQADLQQAAADVSQSIGQEWSADRPHKRFVSTCVRRNRSQARPQRRTARRGPDQQGSSQLDSPAPSPKPRCAHIGIRSKKRCVLPPHSKRRRHRY